MCKFPYFFLNIQRKTGKKIFFTIFCAQLIFFFIPLHVGIDYLQKKLFIYEEKDSNT